MYHFKFLSASSNGLYVRLALTVFYEAVSSAEKFNRIICKRLAVDLH